MLHVVPQVGGRLMGICHEDDELCFINPALAGKIPLADGSDWSELCGEWTFPLWGGGKTWVAPESQWPGGAPHVDLDSGAYVLRSSWITTHSMGVVLESPICHLSGLQIERRIELFRDTMGWRVTHTVTNRGIKSCQCGAWDVLMLRRPAMVHIPLPGKLVDWREAVRPSSNKTSLSSLYETGVIGINRGALNVSCNYAIEFKVGVLSDRGEIHVRFNTTSTPLSYKRRTSLLKEDRYAHGHPIEVFNAPSLAYFEVESHSRLASLEPGAAVMMIVDEELVLD